ncbi:MAG TPA: hypothetical protein VGO95_03945 [Modestobacter sp.]|nr:hypothetical protein [Modestobacter sp.]
MISDRELDAQLAGAAGVHDEDLPVLPDAFLAQVRMTAEEPASVVAARQLVSDARDDRTTGRPRRRPGRRAVVRVAAAVVAVAAAWTTAVLVAPHDDSAPPPVAGTPTPGPATPGSQTPSPTAGAPAGGLTLVAAETVTFPFSLDPAPAGLTPEFSRRGGTAYYGNGPLEFVADWSSDEGRVLVDLFPADPRELPDTGWSEQGDPAGTVTVDGVPTELREDDGVVTLLWERPDGRWVWVLGEGSYADTAAVVAVAESIVDRPQPVGLQFGLAPAGWSVGGYEASHSLDLVSDDDPTQSPLRVSLFGGPGYEVTIDAPFEGRSLTGPVEPVTVQGLPARIALTTPDDGGGWLVTGQLAGGPLFLIVAPPALTREQVLEIAAQITYAP